MSVPVVHEADIQELDLPGRRMRWLISEDGQRACYCSFCVIRIAPGEKVRPAHSHPNGEEVIYIMSGSGRVLVNGEVAPVMPGSAVLFPQGHIHLPARPQILEYQIRGADPLGETAAIGTVTRE